MGTVKEKSTGEPIIGAHIIMIGNSSVGAVSNIDGEFAIECPIGEHLFLISFIGYNQDTIKVVIEKDIISSRVLLLTM